MSYAKILCFFIQFLLVKANYSKNVMEPLIIGGEYTNISSYPHAVYIAMDCEGGTGSCGASFINQRILLTAAHCVEMCSIKGYDTVHAYAGHEDTNKMKIVRSIKTLLMHSGYVYGSFINDIALGASETNFPLGDTIKRVIIQRSFPSTRTGYVAGWGITDGYVNRSSTILKSVQQVILSKATCAELHAPQTGKFCAVNIQQPNTPSNGDSGSAFITKQYQQLGIVSYTVQQYPLLEFYTNVSYYYDWIKANTRQIFCHKKLAKYIQL